MNKPLDRRNFLKTAGVSIAAAASGSLLASRAYAQEKLTESDPTAQALKYHENAATLSADSTPGYQTGRLCGNCALYQTAAEADGHAPCSAFSGKLVAHGGWCMAWAQKS